MDFLLNYVNEKTIEEIQRNNDPNVVLTLMTNPNNVIKNIEYLQSIGVISIGDLLIYRTEIFFKEKEKIEQYFLEHDCSNLVKKINLDIELVDLF